MKNTVIIKGNKYGITIVLDKDVEFTTLIKDLSTKLEEAEAFFDSDKQLAVAFEGRELSNNEMDELLEVIKSSSKLNIQYVIEQNNDLEVTFFDIIQNAKLLEQAEAQLANMDKSAKNNPIADVDFDMDFKTDMDFDYNWNDAISDKNTTENDGLFYKGTLRSGQSLEAKDSLIVIGDINPGANVIAGGNVVVIGSLKGCVTAGANGNRKAFVMALSMAPMQIQIADVIARSSDAKKIPKSKKEDAMIATIIDNQICIEMVSKAAMHDRNI